MRISALLLLLIGIYMSACVSKNKNSDLMKSDEFSWLEEVEGDRALKWVDAQNQKSLEFLKSDPRFPETQKSIEKILADKNRIPFPTIAGPMIYNHWTDEKNPRGLWRRCTLQEYKKAKPNWEIVIDVDQLGKAENVSWVFKGAQLLPPDYKRALVSLSRGGKDAREIREFDLEKKTFIKEGFFIPEAKSDVAWIDENTLHVGTDFGPATMTKSGYPRIVKIWKRGQPLTEAKLLFEGNENDVGVNSFNIFRPEKNYTFVTRSLNFFESQIYYLKKSDELVLLPIPKKADINGVLNEKIYFSIHEDWQDGKQRFTSGSLLQFDLKEFLKNGKTESQLIFQPDKRSSLNNVVVTRTKVWLEISRNVNSSVLELNRDLTLRRLSLPKIGQLQLLLEVSLTIKFLFFIQIFWFHRHFIFRTNKEFKN